MLKSWIRGVAITLLVAASATGGALLFTSWRERTCRLNCIMQQKFIQQAVRSWCGMNGINPGGPVDWKQIIGPGKFVDLEGGTLCPLDGTPYQLSKTQPQVGEAAAVCRNPNHRPETTENW
ncbi:MAG: hypothetical protein QM755_16610 [Luteolibacter sp.]